MLFGFSYRRTLTIRDLKLSCLLLAISSLDARSDQLSDFGSLKYLKDQGFGQVDPSCVFESRRYGPIRGELPFTLFGHAQISYWGPNDWFLKPKPSAGPTDLVCEDGTVIGLSSFEFSQAWNVTPDSSLFGPTWSNPETPNWIELSSDEFFFEHTAVKRSNHENGNFSFFLCSKSDTRIGKIRNTLTSELSEQKIRQCTYHGVAVEIRVRNRKLESPSDCSVFAIIADASLPKEEGEKRRSITTGISGDFCDPDISKSVKSDPFNRFVSATINSIKRE